MRTPLAVVAIAVLALTGCSFDAPPAVPTMNSAEAINEYQQLYGDIEAAMSSADVGELQLDSLHSLVPQDDDPLLCGLWLGRVSSSDEIEIANARADEFVALIDPILANHGWPALVFVKHENGPGYPDYESELEDGTANVGLSIRGGRVTASVFTFVTDDPCDP